MIFAAKLVVGPKVLPSPGEWVIDATAKFTPPNDATFFISPLPTPQRFCDIVQFTMYRLNVSFKFFGDLQNYTFLESLEPTEPEK